MAVTPHNAQHETARELPLITESARVTSVSAMDRDRRAEIREIVEDVLTIEHRDEWLGYAGEDDELDWDRLGEHVDAADHDRSWVQELDTLESRYERAYPSLLRIGMDAGEAFDFTPGQYLTLRYDGVPRPYSIASSPNRDETELAVRRVPNGKLSATLCDELSAGDEVTLRGPNGDFVMEDVSDRDLVFMATGTGVAPLRSMIDYVFEEGRDEHGGTERDVWLFLGASWKDDLPFREEFRDLAAAHDNFHFVPTLSRESYLGDWDGETAYIQHTLVKYLADDPDATFDLDERKAAYLDREPRTDVDARLEPESVEIYACGINAMVYSLVETATGLGVPETHVHSEGYG